MTDTKSGIKRLWNEDRDAKRVAAVMFAALVCGAILVAFATPKGQAFAGLLWAAACSSVGWFLGFLFGIPRTLSTDTARTTAPASPDLSGASSKAAASRASAERSAKDKAIAEQNASARAADADSAAENAANATKQAELNPDDPELATKSAEAKAAADQAMEAKRAADAAAAAATSSAKAAADQAEADRIAALAAKNAVAETAPQLAASDGPSTTVNTNLEQISDWLTKIIVGVTLVESRKVLDQLSDAAQMMAGSIGGESSVSFAFAILIYFSFSGLLGSYLLTRLFLQRAFTTAASSAERVTQ